ncbi:MAG: hypothetical protein ACNFW9_04265 [Candidatus Kerfeldbacteria bacterium]|jgi:hypothetical protein
MEFNAKSRKLFKKVIDEYNDNQRTLILNGHTEEEPFQLYPIKNSELEKPDDIFGINDASRISRIITTKEAIQLKDDPNCDNSTVINFFLSSIGAI